MFEKAKNYIRKQLDELYRLNNHGSMVYEIFELEQALEELNTKEAEKGYWEKHYKIEIEELENRVYDLTYEIDGLEDEKSDLERLVDNLQEKVEELQEVVKDYAKKTV